MRSPAAPELRAWLYEHDSDGEPRIHAYRERCQRQREQLNDTWAYCVNIADVCRGVNVKTRDVPPLLIEEYEQRLDLQRSLRNGNGQGDLWNDNVTAARDG